MFIELLWENGPILVKKDEILVIYRETAEPDARVMISIRGQGVIALTQDYETVKALLAVNNVS